MSGLMLGLMAALAAAMVASSLLLLRHSQREQRFAMRLRSARFGPAQATRDEDRAPRAPLPAQIVGGLGRMIAGSGLLPAKTLAELQHTLTAAGFRGRNGLGIFIGSKLLMLLGSPVLAWVLLNWWGWSGLKHTIGVGAAGVLGLLAPDWTVRTLRNRYLKRVEAGLADALDMMVICAEAGLALEPTISRVGREIGPAHPTVSAEFLQTASELRIVADHRVALQHMASRTAIDGIKRLTTTMVQTLQYGTPLTDALRVLSAELRQEMLTRFEARAARLPVLLTLPMIVFILPCVFLIVGGPAMIQVYRTFH